MSDYNDDRKEEEYDEECSDYADDEPRDSHNEDDLEIRGWVPLSHLETESSNNQVHSTENRPKKHSTIKIRLRRCRPKLSKLPIFNPLVALWIPKSRIYDFSHTPDKLARAIKHFSIPGSYYNEPIVNSTHEGTAMIHWAKTYYAALRNVSVPPPEDLAVLDTYFRLFDKFFFFGSLRRQCVIRLMPSLLVDGQRLSGHTVTYRRQDDHPAIPVILISLQDLTRPKATKQVPPMSIEDRHKNYAETLLHEMVHAYLLIYSCKCSKGIRGHGRPWQKCAKAIEKASRYLLSERLDLGRTQAMADEWYRTGHVPSEDAADMESLGLDYAEVKRCFDETRAQAEHHKRSGEKRKRSM